jgi:hypothetical protein
MNIIEEINAELGLDIGVGKLTLTCRQHALVHSASAAM